MKLSYLIMCVIFIIPSIAYCGEPYEFTNAIIDSLEHATGCNKKLNSPQDTKESAFMMREMITVQYAIQDLNKACLVIDKYQTSNNELIQKSAKGFSLAFQIIVDAFSKQIELLEELGNATPETFYTKQGTWAKRGSEIAAQANEGWDLVIKSAVMSTYILIDASKTENGHLCCLNLNNNERNKLMTKMKTSFPYLKGGLDACKLKHELAIGAIWKVLSDAQWKAAK